MVWYGCLFQDSHILNTQLNIGELPPDGGTFVKDVAPQTGLLKSVDFARM